MEIECEKEKKKRRKEKEKVVQYRELTMRKINYLARKISKIRKMNKITKRKHIENAGESDLEFCHSQT